MAPVAEGGGTELASVAPEAWAEPEGADAAEAAGAGANMEGWPVWRSQPSHSISSENANIDHRMVRRISFMGGVLQTKKKWKTGKKTDAAPDQAPGHGRPGNPGGSAIDAARSDKCPLPGHAFARIRVHKLNRWA